MHWTRVDWVCKICEPASHASHRASHACHASYASHSTNVKNFYLFYLHSHDNILDEFFTRAVSWHELSFRSRYQNNSFFFISWGCDGPRDKTSGHELSSRSRFLYSGAPNSLIFFASLVHPPFSPMYSASHYSFESKHLASVVKCS